MENSYKAPPKEAKKERQPNFSHPAPMVVNRFFGGVNNVVLEIY